MIQLDTVIFNHNGRFFRFKKKDSQYICDVCYWKGIIHQEEQGWSAEILQKYDPFEHHKTTEMLTSVEDGMRWITERLIKKESY